MPENGQAAGPMARNDGLAIRKLQDEVLIYDLERHRVHCLSQTAANVWTACNGERTVPQIVDHMSGQMGSSIQEEIVLLALQDLTRRHLLVGDLSVLDSQNISRRDLIRRLGLTAAVALPLVSSLIAPKAAQASTCLAS